MRVQGMNSDSKEVVKGVPQGSVLVRVYIYTLYCLDVNIEKARFHFYADTTVIYCSAPTKQEALRDLQSVFDTIRM